MPERLTVLASGSSGNAALLETDGFGVLIDCGLAPRLLSARLREVGASWDRIQAVILTHIHGDHWKDLTLADLRSRKIPLYAHPAHLDHLALAAENFEPLRKVGLARTYTDHRVLELAPGLMVQPIWVSHDAEPTFAFRIDRWDDAGIAWSIGFASDLGCGSHELIEAFAGVDVLALEYNHDVQLQLQSPRSRYLVERVLSDLGHLSNDQAAELTAAIASRSGEGFPRRLVQLHLSRECNRVELAAAAGRAALASLNPQAEIITARQEVAAKPIPLARRADSPNRVATRTTVSLPPVSRQPSQPTLPGFEG
jgi:phosphoribosyl 1,2-cyclic phosphodiesterase